MLNLFYRLVGLGLFWQASLSWGQSPTQAQTETKTKRPQISAEENHQPLEILLRPEQNELSHPFSLHTKDQQERLFAWYLLAEPLFALSPEHYWDCRLCTEFPSFTNGLLEMNSDPEQSYAIKMTLTLNKNARWGDGELITGHDFFFSWQVASQLEGEFLGKAFYDRIEHMAIDAHNPNKVTVFFRERLFFADDLAHVFLLPKHLEEELWKHSSHEPELYLKKSLYVTAAETPGLYSGAYLVATFNQASLGNLKPNPFHNSGLTPLPGIQLLSYPLKPGTFLENQLVIPEQICPYTLCPEPSSILPPSSSSSPLPRVIWGDSNSFEFIAINQRNPILKDQRIRQALALAIDKEYLMSKIFHDEVIPAAHFLHPKHPAFNPQVKLYPFDLKASQVLLEEAGWKLNPQDGRRYKLNKPLRFTLVTNKNPLRKEVVDFLTQTWKKIGIEVTPILEDDRLFFNKIVREIHFDGLALFAWDIPIDASFNGLFHSEAIPTVYNDYLGQNLSSWIHPKVDELISSLDLEFHEHKRNQLLAQLQSLYSSDLPAIPLFFHLRKAYAPSSLPGFFIPGNQLPSSAYISQWQSSPPPKIATEKPTAGEKVAKHTASE